MPTYQYLARDLQGKAVRGMITANDERAGREQLRINNLFVTDMEQVSGRELKTQSSGGLFAPRVKLYDMVVFSRQLATLVRAGLPLVEALGALADQTKNATLNQTIRAMIQSIREGSTFVAAMKPHPKLFSELYLALVEAGELGGLLDMTLETAASSLDTEMEIREKVRSAFVYPIAVAVVAVGVVTALLTFVVPIFADVYTQFHAELPSVTQMLVTISFLVRTYWWAGILGLIATIFIVRQINLTHKGRRFFDRLKVGIPLFGPIIDKIALARMAHTLASMSNAGIPLIRALPTAGRVSGDSHIQDALEVVSEKVQQGVSIGLAMHDTARFPLLLTRMIASGETSGNLSEMLEQAAHFYDREVDYGVKRLMTMIEPIMTAVMGLIVGFILLALYMPIFNLGKVIK
ncbi:MAG: type II secretion system F family protein [Armatimonas sp.]